MIMSTSCPLRSPRLKVAHHRRKEKPRKKKKVKQRMVMREEEKEDESWFVERMVSGSIASTVGLVENCLFVSAVLLNIATFAFANGSTGTWVRAWVRLHDDQGESPLVVANILALGTFGTIKQFWVSGAKITAILTGATAGGFPYFLLVLILATWFSPMKNRSIIAGTLLQAVRFEHSLTFAAILLCVALKTDVPIGNLADIKLRAVFGWGLVAFEIATLLSFGIVLWLIKRSSKQVKTIEEKPCVFSEVEVSFRQRDDFEEEGSEKKDDDLLVEADEESAVSLDTKILSSPNSLHYEDASSIAWRLSRQSLKWYSLFLLSAAANVVFAVCGIFVPSARFTVRELAVLVVETKRRHFSVYKVLRAINGSTRRKSLKAFWCIWLGTFVIVLPIFTTLSLFVLLITPLTKEKRTRLFFFTRRCHALASADVFFIVLANFAKNVNIISDWIINDQAPKICHAVDHITHYDGCMKIDGSTLRGFWFLGAHCIFNNLLFLLLYLLVYRSDLYASIRKRIPSLLPSPASYQESVESSSSSRRGRPDLF